MKLLPTLLAALAYTGAQRLTTLARKIAPGLPATLYVTTDHWFHLPDAKHIVLAGCSMPEVVRSLHRHPLITIAVVEQPDGELAALFLTGRESPGVLWGRDEDGYPLDDSPENPPADMDALIRAATALPTRDPLLVN